MRIHYFQHVPFEGLGYLETWANQRPCMLSATLLYENALFPSLSTIDMLVVMGGSMGVYEQEKFSWLEAEIQYIQKAIEAQKIVVGICLGSQLIAAALGARVYPNIKKEIGWFPLTKTSAGKEHPLLQDLPENFIGFHWHGDTFDLPQNAVHLLQTDICPHQAFLYQEKVLGLQFHLEATPQSIKDMIAHGQHELVPDTFIQNAEMIQKQEHLCKQGNEYLSKVLDRLVLK